MSTSAALLQAAVAAATSTATATGSSASAAASPSGSQSGSISGSGSSIPPSLATTVTTTVVSYVTSTKSTPATTSVTGVAALFNGNSGKAQEEQGVSLQSFVTSLGVAAIVFGVEVVLFVLLRKKLHRIYEPRTYLVPEKRKTPAPEPGFLNFFKPVLATANSDFISKSGLDAYFFLRYLLMLLKFFVGLAIVILPILLPVNYSQGKGKAGGVKGLDQLAWSNVSAGHTSRYWGHLFLAIFLVIFFCYMAYAELRKYIRLRQTYLTSPQHRLRASATTVLVSGIPKRWLSVKMLVELYDVFPGGIRNVWINRDYDDLQEKVELRDSYAKALETAETELIRMAKKNHMKQLKKAAKTDPKAEAARKHAEQSEEIANGPGISSGNPHQIPDSVRDASPAKPRRNRTRLPLNPLPALGGGVAKLGQGVLGGVNAAGRGVVGGVSAAGRGVVGGVTGMVGGVRRFNRGVEGRVTPTDGCDTDESACPPEDEKQQPQHNPYFDETPENHSQQGTKRGSTLVGPDGQAIVRDRSESRSPREENPPALISEVLEGSPRPMESDDHGGARKRPLWHRKGTKISDEYKTGDEDEAPLSQSSPIASPTPTDAEKAVDKEDKKKEKKKKHKDVYPEHCNEQYSGEEWGDPVWKKYVSVKKRPTMRLPLHPWLPSLPLIGKKVDTITYCRKELARLNVEIEQDQENHETKYPLMNSAFIQFNQQVAAHMACQAVSHHVPQHMTPRHIEVSPNDVIWGNMKMQWWERYLRKAAIIAATGGLVIGWAFPVAVVGLLSQIDYLTDNFTWLAWLKDIPDTVLGLISGVLPAVLLGALMALLPIILRLFARLEGCHTGMAAERSVQGMYFAFLFIQIFLVVSISSGITAVFTELKDNPIQAPSILAENLPKASNFFFSYLLLQAFSVSGGALMQIGTLVVNFLLAPILDTTARDKFNRATSLMEVKWGTFFPVYTNLACIGIVYSIISPLILIFNCITFSLFWLVYRYNLLFVVNFRFDTGGLLFPRAINQLFTGVYVMEICLIGLFFLVRDSDGDLSCGPHGSIMIVVLVLTVLYQITLNRAFGPLYTYLPITLEDDAVLADEKFAQEQDARRKRLLVPEEEHGDDLNDILERKEREEMAGESDKGIEMRPVTERRGRSSTVKTSTAAREAAVDAAHLNVEASHAPPPKKPAKQPEIALFQDIADEIEDLTPEERDVLVARAFQHPALRAKRPVIWVPRDDLGVSDDEIRRTMALSDKIWISNEYAGLDGKARVVYRRSPPDLDMRDLVEL